MTVPPQIQPFNQKAARLAELRSTQLHAERSAVVEFIPRSGGTELVSRATSHRERSWKRSPELSR